MKLKNFPIIIKNISSFIFAITKELVKGVFKPVSQFLIQTIDVFRSTLVPSYKEQIVQQVFNKQIANDNICFFSHFDSENKVADYVFFYLDYLYENFSVDIIFTSTCQTLDEASLTRLENVCRSVILRENYSLDFGSSKLAWELYKSDLESHYDKLIITNDSQYGPFFPFHEKIKQTVRDHKPQFIGCTDSWENSYHIQSYFMLFNRLCHQSTTFNDFWKHFRFFRHKYHLIERCEVGLSLKLIRAGVDVQALFPYINVLTGLNQDTQLANRLKLLDTTLTVNPTHHFWHHLIKQQFPFVKIELLRDNPAGLVLSNLETELNASDYPKELFLNHLQQTTRRNKEKVVDNMYSDFFQIDARPYRDQR